jgi:hypothetical protein
VVTVGVGWRPQPVDDEYANTRQREDRFSTPFLDQLRWDHRESRKGQVLSVGLNGTQRDQRLARTTLGNHRSCSGLLPAPDQAHEGERLGRVRLPKELAYHWGRWVVDSVKGRVGIKDSVP